MAVMKPLPQHIFQPCVALVLFPLPSRSFRQPPSHGATWNCILLMPACSIDRLCVTHMLPALIKYLGSKRDITTPE